MENHFSIYAESHTSPSAMQIVHPIADHPQLVVTCFLCVFLILSPCSSKLHKHNAAQKASRCSSASKVSFRIFRPLLNRATDDVGSSVMPFKGMVPAVPRCLTWDATFARPPPSSSNRCSPPSVQTGPGMPGPHADAERWANGHPCPCPQLESVKTMQNTQKLPNL